MARQLVIRVSLEDVSTSLEQLSHDVDMTAMCGEVQGSPLVDTSSHIQIEVFFIA